MQLRFKCGDLFDALRVLARYVENIPLIRHHTRPAADTLVAHAVERVWLQTCVEDVIDHLLRRPVEHGPQKIISEFLSKCPYLLTPIGVRLRFTHFIVAVRLK